MRNNHLIMALDQGTTSSRAILWNSEFKPVAVAQREFPQMYPRPGWVEHDPAAILESQMAVMEEALGMVEDGHRKLAALAIANQRETIVVWERKNGRPVYPAIVWQCRRTSDFCEKLRSEGLEEMVQAKTGLVLDPYFSASKIRWILYNVPGAAEAARKGELLAGTVDSWLIWNLTRGRSHVTDYTNASRTQLLNIKTTEWDEDLLELYGIPPAMMPRTMPSGGNIAECAIPRCGERRIPILGVAGDQQAALFGQRCLNPGEAKNTYGTGCFLLMNLGDEFKLSENGLLTTLTAQTSPGKPVFALEGSVFMGGAIMQWLRDELGILAKSGDAGPIAASVPDSGGVYLVPAFTGLGAPYWDSEARGAIVGLTRGSGRRHIIRAAEEAIALQCADLVAAMQSDAGSDLRLLRVDGGAAADDFLMQTQADILGCEVERPAVLESTALGAAALAARELGWDTDAINPEPERRFSTLKDDAWRKNILAGWHNAVRLAATRPL